MAVRFLWAGEGPWVSLRQRLELLRYLLGFSRQVFQSAVHVARVVSARRGIQRYARDVALNVATIFLLLALFVALL